MEKGQGVFPPNQERRDKMKTTPATHLHKGSLNPAFELSPGDLDAQFDNCVLKKFSQLDKLDSGAIIQDLQYSSQSVLYQKDYSKDDQDSFSETKGNNSGKKICAGARKYAGIFLAFAASLFFSFVVLFVKVLTTFEFDAYSVSFWRQVGTIIPTIPLLFFFEWGPGTKKQSSVFESVWPVWENEKWKVWAGLLSRGIIGSSAIIFRYYALQYLTIGDTSVITYSTPVVVTILAHFFLGERCGWFQMIIAFVTLSGVVIVTRPPVITGAAEFDSKTLIGTALACGSLLCSAIAIVLTRQVRAVHFTVQTLTFGTVGMAQVLLLIAFLGNLKLPTELTDSLLVAGVASLSFLGVMSTVLALKFENAGPVSLVRSCDVLFGFLLQFVFLNVSPDVFSAVGAVIVLFGVLSIAFRKWVSTLPEDDGRKKTWRFVLK